MTDQPKLLRWVKASDRLPDKIEKRYCVKDSKDGYGLAFRGDPNYWYDGKKRAWMYVGDMYNDDVEYWLEEYTEPERPDQPQAEVPEEIMQWIEAKTDTEHFNAYLSHKANYRMGAIAMHRRDREEIYQHEKDAFDRLKDNARLAYQLTALRQEAEDYRKALEAAKLVIEDMQRRDGWIRTDILSQIQTILDKYPKPTESNQP